MNLSKYTLKTVVYEVVTFAKILSVFLWSKRMWNHNFLLSWWQNIICLWRPAELFLVDWGKGTFQTWILSWIDAADAQKWFILQCKHGVR